MKKERCYQIKEFLAGILMIIAPSLSGQQSNSLYLLHEIPQSNLLNPAVQLECKWFVGIPLLSSVHGSYSNTSFTYNQIADGESLNLERVLGQMHRVDLAGAEAMYHPISLGYRHKSYYFTFQIAEKAYLYQTVPKDLARVVVAGNGSFIGETARFNAFRPTGYYNREYAVGVSKAVDQFWILGLRAKLLFGKANLTSGHSKMELSTDENNFDLSFPGEYTLNSSLPVTIEQDADGNITNVILDDLNYAELLLNRGNPGFAIDVGAIYKLDNKVTLSASLLDLGMVHWSTELNNVSASGLFKYNELDTNTDAVSWNFLNELIDSVMNSFNVKVTHQRYNSFLPAQLLLGGRYQLRENLSVGAVNRNLIFRSKVHSSLTLMASTELADGLLASLSWSYLNNSIMNVGAVIAFTGKGLQFHVASDNLLGFFFPFDTRTINLRMGINLMLGCPRDKRSKMENESHGQLVVGGNCSWTERPGKRRKAMLRAARKQN